VWAFLTKPRAEGRWTLFVRGTGLVGLIGIPVLLIWPDLGPLVCFGLLAVPANSVAGPLVPISFELLIVEAAKHDTAIAVAAVATAVYMYMEYLNWHLYRWILAFDRFAALRDRRWMQRSVHTFSRFPFLTVMLFAFTPLPFWAVRVVAVLGNYNISRFMLATMIGRAPRFYIYAWAGSLLQVPTILLILAFGAVAVVITMTRSRRGRPIPDEEIPSVTDGQPLTESPLELSTTRASRARTDGKMAVIDEGPSAFGRVRSMSRQLRTGSRLIRIAAKATVSARHPVLVHIVPIRRCNLSCSYCAEHDGHSLPVPVDTMTRRVDRLAGLRASMLSFSGGEPLLHRHLDQIIAHAVSKGIFTELLTNGYLLTAENIGRLNAAGLNRLQISVDNVKPDSMSMKSLEVLDEKLALLARHASFDVNVNTVLMPGMKNPADALVIARRAREFGFSGTVGIVHDENGQLRPLGRPERVIYKKLRRSYAPPLALMTRFQKNVVDGRANQWRCRAGSRYLYVCEEGIVHYCSQQRGCPGIPLDDFGPEDLKREFDTEKPCARMCTITCVHAVAIFDSWRRPQKWAVVPDSEPASGAERSRH
jgi:MoaA/NifB/PqqE/SkfB family radical SAM enzyme/membrane protein YqaA with SNARE-associated domain